MLNTTLLRLRCPRRKRGNNLCLSRLKLYSQSHPTQQEKSQPYEVTTGHLQCEKCRSQFPILAGVAILVEDVRMYLLSHVKGIAQAVPDSDIPKEFLRDFLEAKAEIETEHIEEDLESERILSLYVLNHYLRVSELNSSQAPWWRSKNGEGSALMDELIRKYWDQGPMSQIQRWVKENAPVQDVVELGCGVGGLYPTLKSQIRSYLGVDSSFVSIAVGRHLALGVPYRGKIRFPEDLLQGPVSRSLPVPASHSFDGHSDFVVGDLDALPLAPDAYDLAVALNAIDMMDVPSQLPRIQKELVRKNGMIIQSCPYIWHPRVAQELRKSLPSHLRDSSSQAVEWLYQQAGLKIEKSVQEIPWLFFKHLRQLEIYSVHAFLARKP